MGYDARKAKKEAEKLNQEVAKLLGKFQRTIDWDFSWKANRTHGKCVHVGGSRYKILISKSLAEESDVRNTVLHELCHAYAPTGSGHGPNWKAIADKVGNAFGENITRVSSKKHDADSRKPFAELECPVCGHVYKLWKRTSYAYKDSSRCWCSHCGKERSYGKLIKRVLR